MRKVSPWSSLACATSGIDVDASRSPPLLRPFTTGDRFALNRWLADEDVVAWFGTRAIADADCALAQSSPSAFVRMATLDDRPIGYLHAYDCAVMGGARPATLADGVYLISVVVGPPDMRGKGYGAAAVSGLRDDVFATTFADRVAILVPLKNESAVRALERHGFRWREIWRDAHLGPCWILEAARPPR